MSYRSHRRTDSDISASLDALGFNPMEGVQFHLNPSFAPPTELLQRVHALLQLRRRRRWACTQHVAQEIWSFAVPSSNAKAAAFRSSDAQGGAHRASWRGA